MVRTSSVAGSTCHRTMSFMSTLTQNVLFCLALYILSEVPLLFLSLFSYAICIMLVGRENCLAEGTCEGADIEPKTFGPGHAAGTVAWRLENHT